MDHSQLFKSVEIKMRPEVSPNSHMQHLMEYAGIKFNMQLYSDMT